MKTIEIRRHACTVKGAKRGLGSHLSQAGVSLARELGSTMPRPNLVMTSAEPRSLETALAMGFAVDQVMPVPPDLAGPAMRVVGHRDRWSWPEPWVHFRHLTNSHIAVATYAQWMAARWFELLNRVPSHGHALVISHGRDIELGVIATVPGLTEAVLATLGEPLHQCEGVTMALDCGLFRLVEVHRARRCHTIGI